MDKPRICEVLGVEVGERFDVAWLDDNPYHITPEGFLEDKDGYQMGVALSDIINYPDRIIRKPRWTEQEVEDALYTKRILKVDTVRRSEFSGGLDASRKDGNVSIVINRDMFPSLRPGETVTLDEIINSANGQYQKSS